jgi:hypothetical protein
MYVALFFCVSLNLIYIRCKVTIPAPAISFCLYTQCACCAGGIILLFYTIHMHSLLLINSYIYSLSFISPHPPFLCLSILWERTVSIILYTFNSPILFTPFIYLEGLYHGQSEPEVDLYLSTLPVRVHTHTYIYIYIFLSRLEICEC